MSCFVWDVDVCDMVSHVHAGLFATPDDAADAWHDWVGGQGTGVELHLVETLDRDLLWEESFFAFRGNETRTHLDSWQFLRRAAVCVGQVLPDPVPAAGRDGAADETRGSAFGVDPVDTADKESGRTRAMRAEDAAFAAWFETETGVPMTDEEKLDAQTVSYRWCSLTPEYSWGVVSPHRAEGLTEGLKDDYLEEAWPGLLAMAPLWVRFQAGRGPTPSDHVEHVLAVASGAARREPHDCPGLPLWGAEHYGA